MRFQLTLIILLVACLLPAHSAQRIEHTASGIRTWLDFAQRAPVPDNKILDEDGVDTTSFSSQTYALPYQDVNVVVNNIKWNVFDTQGNLLYQESQRHTETVEVANSFTFREMRGFTIRLRNQFAQGDLRYVLSDVDYSISGQGIIELPTQVSPAFVDAYKILADNYDSSYLRGLPVSRPKMLIISHPNLANYQQDFIKWKRSLGFDVTVVNRVDIGDTVNQIKAFLTSHYHQHHPDYLMLFGDVTGSYSIPTAFFPSPEFQENDADDHQYALIEGDDYFPEMLVGRFSFNDISELMSMANKTIVFEKSPFMGNTNWMKRSIVVAGNYASGNLHPSTPIQMSRWLRDKMLDHGYAQVDSVFFPPTYPGNTEIASVINQGVQFVSYRGWGDANGWHYPSFKVPDVSSLVNYQRMPIVYSIVCNTGDFANTVNPCFGEKWMRMGSVAQPNGCVGFVGPSDLHTKTRFNNSISSGAFRSILDYGVRGFGSSVLMGKMELYKNFPNDIGHNQYVGFYFHVYNLLSDPSLNMWVLVPNTISADLLPSTYASSSSHITITAPHLEGAMVSGTKNSETYTYARIVDGTAILPINPQEDGNLTITISKPNYVPLVKTLTSEDDGGLAIIANSVSDAFIDPNQSLNASLTLQNLGEGTLSLDSVTIEGNEKLSVSQINNPSSIAPQGTAELQFTISATADIIPREPLDLNIQINSLPVKSFRLWGGGAEFTVTGNEGNYPIGESSTVEFTIFNHSQSPVNNASLRVITLTEAATFPTDAVSLGAIAPGESKSFTSTVTIKPDAWNGRHIPLKMQLTDNDYSTEFFYSLTAGTVSTTSPTGPDAYGYYAYDSFDLGFTSTPVYEWVEIDPLLGGNASVFLDPDDASKVIDLPFTFRFYGRDFDQITICTNGWISMGATDMVDFYNHYIPAALGPNSLIAGYWDDLKGLPLGYDEDNNQIFDNIRILYWHDTANNRFIVQWNEAYNQYNLTSLEKFQIMLYPKGDDDGDILVQYHTVDNPGMTSNYCTVGIENHNHTVGLGYTHGNVYDPTATPLQPGLAIRFTTTPPDNYTSNDDALQTPVLSLSQNFPNPFNPSTTISFQLSRPAHTRLAVYNLKGQLVKVLADGNLGAHQHDFVWNGLDEKDEPVASGMYLYRLHTDGKTLQRKMLLMK
ncbi:MAG: T9SS type A sorting domain-containing protein [Candidatus Cloacimonetes bacterium]|nr:T9SS type A sorting domain-containing protein [Candidatus Cloacimonadota bacterium]